MADKKYAEIAKALDLPASTTEEGVQSLIKAVKDLINSMNVPNSFEKCGVARDEYMSKLSDIANKAFEDQCTTANPRLPLVSEIEEIMIKAYEG